MKIVLIHWILGVVLVGIAPFRADAKLMISQSYDCGITTLYKLIKLEKMQTDLRTLAEHLPPARSGGYSMLELREAARACGLRLVGVKLTEGDSTPDRPALVFLNRGEHGHFITIRPVGHTGKLVQVLDPNVEPYVLDYANLIASPEWTGLALVPIRTNWAARIAAGGVGLLGVGAGAWWVGTRRRRALTSAARGV